MKRVSTILLLICLLALSAGAISSQAAPLCHSGTDDACQGLENALLQHTPDSPAWDELIQQLLAHGCDADGDGVPDVIDGCPTDPDKAEPGICGCGVADTDIDSDGTPDCHDNCPDTPNPGQEDSDGDGIGDACDGIVYCSEAAVAHCQNIGWHVMRTPPLTSGVIICTVDGRPAEGNCDGCGEYNIVVWEDGAGDPFCPLSQPYSTYAGNIYCGHHPCECADNLIWCGVWDRQDCIPDP